MNYRSRKSDQVGIEIAPLIDIVFILLIFFVVTSTFIHETVLDLELPSAISSTDSRVLESIEVAISAENEIHVEGKLIDSVSVDVLQALLAEHLVDPESQHLVVRADARARHETVVLVLDAANLLGLIHVNILTLKTDG